MRAHAHVESHIQRLKESGLCRFPFTKFEANATWLMTVALAGDHVRWFQLLCLEGRWREARALGDLPRAGTPRLPLAASHRATPRGLAQRRRPARCLPASRSADLSHHAAREPATRVSVRLHAPVGPLCMVEIDAMGVTTIETMAKPRPVSFNQSTKYDETPSANSRE